MSDLDAAVRLRAFDFLADQRRRFGEATQALRTIRATKLLDGIAQNEA